MCECGEGERLNSSARVAELLRNGEGLSVELKRCSGRIEHDVFETDCAFLDRVDGRCVK